MTELSEQLQQIMEGIEQDHTTDEEAVVVLGSSKHAVSSTPGYDGMVRYYQKRIDRTLRRVYRNIDGRPEFTSTSEATEVVGAPAQSEVLRIMLDALCDGVQIGQGKSYSVKKFALFERMDDIFESPAFHKESDLIKLTVEADPDAVQLVRRQIENTAEFITQASGYSRMPDEMLAKTPILAWKIFDIWRLVAHSSLMMSYVTGYALGRRWADQDVINGIIAATEESTDG